VTLHFPDMTSEIRFVANVVTAKEEGNYRIKYLFAVGFTSSVKFKFLCPKCH